MKKIFDVRLGMLLRHAMAVVVFVYMIVPLVLVAMRLPSEPPIGLGISTALFMLFFIGVRAAQNYKKIEVFLRPLLFTIVSHLLIVFGASYLLPLGAQVSSPNDVQELAGLLGLSMGAVAIYDWFQVLYPEEYAQAGAHAAAKKHELVATQHR